MTRQSLLILAALAFVLVGLHGVLASRLFQEGDHVIIDYTVLEVVLYAAAVFVVLRDKVMDPLWTRRALMFILAIGALLRGMVLFIDPVSTDINRYIWDGRVQDAGINPYLYVPADPALKDLRDTDIYPDINRKTYAPTIYPPFAQIVFYLVTRIDEDITVMKAAMLAFEIVAIVAILRLMKLRRIPSPRILLYLWHPLPVWEIAGSGHVDAIALACVWLGLLAAEMRKPILAGIALGGATLTKFFPALLAPALYRRWDWRFPLAALVTVIVLYLPYLGAGRKLFGFLSGYTDEEGFHDGSGLYLWILLKHLFPALPAAGAAVYMPVALLLLAVLGLFVLFRSGLLWRQQGDGAIDLTGAFVLAVGFTVLSSPHYDWYMIWLVPFLCFLPCWSVIWLTGISTYMNTVGWPPHFWGGSLVYLPFFAILAVEVVSRQNRKVKRHGNPVAIDAG